ncbi:HET domain-containing protein [Nemania abortiva]|nr:HET domain-containing protein [Nemania abortiva]
MWLIHIESMRLKEFTPPDLPIYAILSHTWGEDEVSFQEFHNLESAKKKTGFSKIKKTCELAAIKSIRYAWVDTCCIDKSSSAELSEAINSMFDWYRWSRVCFAYLSDLDEGSPTLWRDKDTRLACRCFRRGWTLQELLAPAELEFYDKAWRFRGFKTDSPVMRELLSITGIRSKEVFLNSNAIREIAVGERMSWASKRQTKRLEDLAYCLLGIFQVNMPMLYGEGMRAFQRLQEEIMKSSTDMSLFCWTAKNRELKYRGLLAQSPAEFGSYYNTVSKSRKSISWSLAGTDKEFSVTNKGIRINAELLKTRYEHQDTTAMRCNLRPDDDVVLVSLRHYRDNVYVRERPDLVLSSDSVEIEHKLIYITKDIDSQMSQDLTERLNLTLSFIVSPPSAPFQLVLIKRWPKEHWRYDTECFQLSSAKISTYVVIYWLSYEGREVGEFAAICQRNASAVQSLRYALVPMREAEDIFKRLEGSIGERIAALSMMEKLIIAGQQTVEVEFESTRVYLFVSRYSPNDEQKPNTLYISIATAATSDRSRSKRANYAKSVNEVGSNPEGGERLENLGDLDSELVAPEPVSPSLLSELVGILELDDGIE